MLLCPIGRIMLCGIALLTALPATAQSDERRIAMVRQAIERARAQSIAHVAQMPSLADWIPVDAMHERMRTPRIVLEPTGGDQFELVALDAQATDCKAGKTLEWDGDLGKGYASVRVCPKFFGLEDAEQTEMALIGYARAMQRDNDCGGVSYGFWISYLDIGRYFFRPVYWEEYRCDQQPYPRPPHQD